MSALRSLQHLDLSCCRKLDAGGMAAIAQLAALTYLDISRCMFEADLLQPAHLAQLTRLSSLRTLHMGQRTISGEALALLDLPHLGDLAADAISASQHVASRGQAITRLELQRPTTQQLEALLPLPSLQHLDMDEVPETVACIARQPQLARLVMSNLLNVEAADLQQMLHGLKALRVLELHLVSGLDGRCLEAVAGMPLLQELMLSGSQVGGEHFVQLVRCPQLCTVTLERCNNVGLAGLMALVCKPGMRKVTLLGAGGWAEHRGQLEPLAQRLGVQLEMY